MSKIILCYSLIVLSVLMAAGSYFYRQQMSIFDPWPSLTSLGFFLLFVWSRSLVRAQVNPGGLIEWHLKLQDRVALTFIVAGVISSYQWLIYFGHLTIEFNINLTLQAISLAIQAFALIQLAIGVIRIFIPPKLDVQ